MAEIRRKKQEWWLERQRARLCQGARDESQAARTTSEDGERRGKTAILLRQNVWDAGANEGREGQAD